MSGTMTIQWTGAAENIGKIQGLNNDLTHTTLSIICDETLVLDELEDTPNAPFPLSFADLTWTLLEHNSSDSVLLATQLCGVEVREKVRQDSISYLTAGILRVVEDRIKGDGTMLFKVARRNLFTPGTRLHTAFDAIGNGIYWSQALLMGFTYRDIHDMLATGYVRTGMKPQAKQRARAGKKRQVMVRSKAQRTKVDDRPAP